MSENLSPRLQADGEFWACDDHAARERGLDPSGSYLDEVLEGDDANLSCDGDGGADGGAAGVQGDYANEVKMNPRDSSCS